MAQVIPAVGRAGGAVTVPFPAGGDGLLPRLKQASQPTFVIGVIDTGIVAKDGHPHPYLAGHLTADSQLDSLTGGSDSFGSLDGHGTFVSGLILAQAPEATIAMRNALDESAGGGDDDKVVAALASLATEPGLTLINLSFFGRRDSSGPPLKIKRALADLFAAHDDVVVVTAAGNEWTDEPAWPAAFNRDFPGRLIAVGAVDETILRPNLSATPPKASFSNYGEWVDAYAGGVQVLGPRLIDDQTYPDDGYPGWRWSGTSFAAASVTGLIARTVMDGPQAGDPPLTCREALAHVLSGPSVALPYGQYRPYLRTEIPA